MAQPAGKPEEEEEGEIELPEVPADILDEWEKDDTAQDALRMFTSDEEMKGKKLMPYRDVTRMLELMGCDRTTFLRMLSAEDDEDDSDEGAGPPGKGGKGASPGKGGKGDFDGKGGKG